MTPSDTGPRGAERTLVERLHAAIYSDVLIVGASEPHFAMLAEAAVEITSLRQQVETLTKERNDQKARAEQAEHWMGEAITTCEAAERRAKSDNEMVDEGWEYVGESGGRLWQIYRGSRCGQRIVDVCIAHDGLGVWVKIASAINQDGSK